MRSFIYLTLLPTLFVSTFASNTPQGSPREISQNSELGSSLPHQDPQTQDLRPSSPHGMAQNPDLGPSLPQDTLRNQELGLGSARVETETSSPGSRLRSQRRSQPGSPQSQSFSKSQPANSPPHEQGLYGDLLKMQDPNAFGMVKHGFKCQKTLYEHTKIQATIDRACKMYKNKQQTVGVNRYPKIWKSSKDDLDSKIIFPLSSGEYFGLGGPRNHFVRINRQCTVAEVLYQVQTKPQQASKHRCRLPNCFSRGGKIFYSCTSLWEQPHNGPDYVPLPPFRVSNPPESLESFLQRITYATATGFPIQYLRPKDTRP